MRRFEVVKEYQNKDINIPVRATDKSAGYDFESAINLIIEPGQIVLVPTGLRAKMPADEVLLVFPRSSLAIKKGLMMSNGVGVVDADYYNADNEGHISVPLYNFTKDNVEITKGERLCQGLFTSYFKTTNDSPVNTIRTGGFGSSGK